LNNNTNDKYEGQFLDGKINGKGKIIHSDGSLEEGEWKNGHKTLDKTKRAE
jgi:hypothetical protein